MVGKVVQYVDAKGVAIPALVLHEFPHDVATQLPTSRFVNLAYVSTDENDLSPFGRATRLATSVPHVSAPKLEQPADAKTGPRLDYWQEA